jgi:4-alpha-glucanotransferase
MTRRAGVLIPLFSIRTPEGWGLGEIPDLVPMARWARQAGFSIVQMLPVNQASGGQDSPYAALTAFALDPVYLALDRCPDFLATGGAFALPKEDQELLAQVRQSPGVRWGDVRALKNRALERAFASFLEREWQRDSPRAQALRGFIQRHRAWLDEFALFVALHEAHGDQSWDAWEPALREREPAALQAAKERLSRRVLALQWIQWQLDEQWTAIRQAVNQMGVKLMGDLPFVVAGDSADVWSRRGDFRMDARVGVPPDAFSADGQDWGLPVYRWDVMRQNDYAWFRARSRRAAELFDYYRVDHVVGLYRTYYRTPDKKAAFIPAEVPAQTQNGESVLQLLSERATVIAEDLGVVPDFVRASLTKLGIPGYRVLRWEKDLKVFRDPAQWPALSVAVTGTHDTDSLADWFEGMDEEEREAFLALPGMKKLRADAPEKFDARVRDALLELVYASGSDLVLLPFQDALGHRERVNVPGTTVESNWTYRMPMEVGALEKDQATAQRLSSLAARTGRLA